MSKNNQTQNVPEWVSITTLAKEKDVTIGCVTNWIRRKKIPVKGDKHGDRLVDRTQAPTVNTYNSGKIR